MVHVLPCRASASVTSLSEEPTAMQAAADLQVTPVSRPVDTGSGWAVHDVPSHDAAMGAGKPVLLLSNHPTAAQAVAEVQDTAASLPPKLSAGAGALCKDHLVP